MEQTSNRVSDMYALYSKGASLQRVGDKFGLSKQRVSKLFQQHGYAVSRHRKHKADEPRKMKQSTRVICQQILDFFTEYMAAHRYPPTLEEIAVQCLGRKPNARGNVSHLVQVLITEKWLYRAGTGARMVYPVMPAPRARYVEEGS